MLLVSIRSMPCKSTSIYLGPQTVGDQPVYAFGEDGIDDIVLLIKEQQLYILATA